MRELRVLALAAACIISQSALANTLAVDFQSVPGADGTLGTADDLAMPARFTPTWITEELAPVGIHFSVGSMVRSGSFNGNPDNIYLSSTQTAAYFDMPVFGIRVDSHSWWNATLIAYDVSGNIVATDRILNDTNEAVYDTLAVTSAAPIYRFTVLPDNPNYIINLDNMVLNITPVPEPSQALLLGAGLLALSAVARRRAQR